MIEIHKAKAVMLGEQAKRHLRLGVSAKEGLFAIALALLSATAFPPLGLWPMSLFAIAFFLRLLRAHSARKSLNLGLLYGVFLGLGTMYWFFVIFKFLAIPLVALMGWYFGILAALIGSTRGRLPVQRAVLVGLFAMGIEWLRGDAWYLRFPWYTVPHALAAQPALISFTRWIGVYGLSGVIWFIGGLGAFRHFAWWGLYLLLPLGWFLLPAVRPLTCTAVLVQAEETAKIETILPTIQNNSHEFVVLPEIAYLSSPESAVNSRRGPGMLARRLHIPVVFGAIEGNHGTADFENVAAVLDHEGKLLGTFTKQRPVPLFHDGKAGTSRPVFPILGDTETLGVAICYDFDAPAVAASLVHSGATVLVAPTYDAMSWSRMQHQNHELLLRIRAVENDRWILRAASSGRTEAIDPRGAPSKEGVEIGETGYVVVEFGYRRGIPLGSWAYLLGPAATILTAMYIGFQICIAARLRVPCLWLDAANNVAPTPPWGV